MEPWWGREKESTVCSSLPAADLEGATINAVFVCYSSWLLVSAGGRARTGVARPGGLRHHSGRWGGTEPQGLAVGFRSVGCKEIQELSHDPAIFLMFLGACLAEYTEILTILTDLN